MQRPKFADRVHIFRAFGASWRGYRGAYRGEWAFRQEVRAAVLLVPLGLWLADTGVERALLVAPVLLVLAVELLNSAIEAVVDRVGFEHHELSGLAKDLGSAAVLTSMALLCVTWLLVLVF